MLTLLAYGMVIVFMTLIMTKRLSPITALILVPIAFGLAGGFAPQLGEMMVAGITKLHEVDPLDDAPLPDIQAGYDTLGQHTTSPRRRPRG